MRTCDLCGGKNFDMLGSCLDCFGDARDYSDVDRDNKYLGVGVFDAAE